MTDRAVIHAEFEEAKPVKTRKCLQIICEVPMERADEALEALGGFPIPGQSRPVAIALLKPGTQATEIADDETPKPERAKRPWHDLPASMQAGIRCAEPAFQHWLHEIPDDADAEDYTARTIRMECQVDSRADLDTNAAAAAHWYRIDLEFRRSQHGESDEDLRRQANR